MIERYWEVLIIDFPVNFKTQCHYFKDKIQEIVNSRNSVLVMLVKTNKLKKVGNC